MDKAGCVRTAPSRRLGIINVVSAPVCIACRQDKPASDAGQTPRIASPPPALYVAAVEGDVDRVRVLLQGGDDVNQKAVSSFETTSLHHASLFSVRIRVLMFVSGWSH